MENLGTKTLGLLSQILDQLGYTTDRESNLLHVSLYLPENTAMVTQVEAESTGKEVVLRVRTKVPDDLLDIMSNTASVNAFAVLGALHEDADGDLCVGSRVGIKEAEIEDGLGLHLAAAAIHYNLNGMIRAMILSRPEPIDSPDVAWTEDEFSWAADRLAQLTPAESKGQSLRSVFLFDEVSVNFAIEQYFHPGLGDGIFALMQFSLKGSDAFAETLNHWEMAIGDGPPHLGAWIARRGFLCYLAFFPNEVYHKGLLERMGPWGMERARNTLNYLGQAPSNSPATL